MQQRDCIKPALSWIKYHCVSSSWLLHVLNHISLLRDVSFNLNIFPRFHLTHLLQLLVPFCSLLSLPPFKYSAHAQLRQPFSSPPINPNHRHLGPLSCLSKSGPFRQRVITAGNATDTSYAQAIELMQIRKKVFTVQASNINCIRNTNSTCPGSVMLRNCVRSI